MLPATVHSLENSLFGEFGREFMNLPFGSSVHTSASGVTHGGAGGSLDGYPTKNGILQLFGIHDSSQINPNSILAPLAEHLADPSNPPSQQPTTALPVSYSTAQPQTIDYLNAELAKHYGMSAETAYQEALANTSYQRAMKDMQAAGLNPAVLFGSGKGSGSDGVSYVSSGTIGSGPSGGITAKSNKKDNLFSEGAYYGLSAAIGLVGALVMKNPTGYWIMNSAAQGAMGAANAAYKSR